MDLLRAELDLVIVQPIADPHAFEEIGITVPVHTQWNDTYKQVVVLLN